MKKEYLSPHCGLVNCEITTAILADSQPVATAHYRNNPAEEDRKNDWGNIWNN